MTDIEISEETRRVFKVGGSLAMILPTGWLAENSLKPGDKVRVLVGKGLIITPLKIQNLKRKYAKLQKAIEGDGNNG